MLFRKHAELVGRVTLMWSDIHRLLGRLFEAFSNSEEARKRYRGTRSDRVQRQLVLSVGSVALKGLPDLQQTLEATIGKIDALARDRNLAIHTFWTATKLPDRKIQPHPGRS